jgi:hypothetical protein
MKTLIYIFVFCSLLCETSFAQASYKSNTEFENNIASQPIWGPVGYNHVEYYYLPEMDVYYYVPKHRFIYAKDGKWKTKFNLPARHEGYDMYNTNKIVINEQTPYLNHMDYDTRAIYSWNTRSTQQSIRDSHNPIYFENRKHPEHSKWKELIKNKEKQQEASGVLELSVIKKPKLNN